ncbi:MAG TPA: S8 family serine peptidase [Baekduia sp.]|nr:S8 family serine peptidase [Baekduia sp.]
MARLAVLAALAGVLAGPARAADALVLRHGPAPAPAAVPGEIVVGFRSGADRGDRAAVRSAADVRLHRDLRLPHAELVRVEAGQTVGAAVRALQRRSDVRYAEPNYVYRATDTTPDDPGFSLEWGLQNTGQAVDGSSGGIPGLDIGAPAAWDLATGTAGTVVAVIDSGVAYDHPDLAPNVWTNAAEIAGNGIDDDGNGKADDVQGWDFVDGDNTPWDLNDHGTHVAGTIAARGNNGIGIAGVAWTASIMPVRALDASGSGTDADIAQAMDYAADNGARVVNLSLGGPGWSQAMSDAITGHPGTLFVVAAGNESSDDDTTPSYPCSYTAANVVCVAATDSRDALASFSNYGATSVDLAAPGVGIYSTRPHFTDQLRDDFEGGLSTWTVQSGSWGTASANSTTWLTDSPTGDYPANADWAIRTASPVDVGARSDCLLRFSYAGFLENGYDVLSVESSPDGTTWTDLADLGDTGGYIEDEGIELGAAGSRYYRFRLTSDATTQDDGVYLDDVRVACPGGTYGGGDYQYLSGTSMATPHVAGAAAVLFGADPGATVAQVKSALLQSGDAVAGLAGKTVTGRRLDLAAALRQLLAVPPPPTAVTGAATGIGTTSATLLGQVGPNGAATTYRFELRPQGGAYGGLHTPEVPAGSGGSPVDVSATATGLQPGTTYAFRLVAVSASGTVRATNEGSFTTSAATVAPQTPVTSTTSATDAATTTTTDTTATDPDPSGSTDATPAAPKRSRVSCRLAGARRRIVRCRVRYHRVRRASFRVRRGRRVYARAGGRRVRSGRAVPLHTLRRVVRGRRYLVLVVVVDGRGRAHRLRTHVRL